MFPTFLSGGPEQFRLSRTSTALLVGYGIALLTLSNAILGSPVWSGWLVPSGLIAIAVIGALLTAIIAANWLGSPMGVAAGLLQLTSLCTLALPTDPLPIGPSIAVLVTGAAGIFAGANVPGRMPLKTPAWATAFFYGCGVGPLLLFGWGEPTAVLLVCLVYLLLNQDGRALRFLSHPIGLGALALFAGIAIWLGQSSVADVFRRIAPYSQQTPPIQTTGWQTPLAVALGMLPWTPLCVLALVAGCRRGHYATAFWQFVTCWSIVPLLLAAAGAIDHRSALAIASAPLSILAAAGLDVLRQNRPLLYGKTARTALRTGRPGT